MKLLSFYLFQAEDGIRDYKVTGVQTCALPICGPVDGGVARDGALRDRPQQRVRSRDRLVVRQVERDAEAARSEERRVGKERRARWATEAGKPKEQNTYESIDKTREVHEDDRGK